MKTPVGDASPRCAATIQQTPWTIGYGPIRCSRKAVNGELCRQHTAAAPSRPTMSPEGVLMALYRDLYIQTHGEDQADNWEADMAERLETLRANRII